MEPTHFLCAGRKLVVEQSMQAKIDTSLVELLLSGCGQEWGSGSGGQREDTVQLKKREKYAITCVEDSIWPHTCNHLC